MTFKNLLIVLLILFLMISACKTFDISKKQKPEYLKFSAKDLESQAYNIELQHLISEFNKKIFQENKDIAELMEKTINTLNRSILLEKLNIEKIENIIAILSQNRIGQISLLSQSKKIEEIYKMADEDFIRAMNAFNDKQYWKSSFLFAQMSSLYPVTYPKLDDSYFYMALSFYNINFLNSSYFSGEYLIDNIPLSDFFEKAYLLLIRASYRLTKYESTLRFAAEFKEKFPQSDSLDIATYYQGLSSYYLLDMENAKKFFDSIEKMSDLYFLSKYYYGLTMYKNEEKLAAHYLNSIPDTVHYNDKKVRKIEKNLFFKIKLTAAQIYIEMDSINNAIGILNNLDISDYHKTEYYFTLGEAYLRNKDFDRAIEVFEKNIDEKTDLYVANSIYKLIYIAREIKDYNLADKYFKKLMEIIENTEYTDLKVHELLVKIDNREQEKVILQNKIAILDILTFSQFKFLHYNDYYGSKFEDDDFLNVYIGESKSKFKEYSKKIKVFSEEIEKMRYALDLLKIKEKVEYQNALIAYKKVINK